METTVAALTEEKSVKLELEGRISELVKQLDEKNSEVKVQVLDCLLLWWSEYH